MKNKKMVATLASLCLIVVAVVAAVVGVLAAVTQSVTSTMTVSFTAKNVDAIVTLYSLGPTKTAGTNGAADTRALETAYATVATTGTHTFNPQDSYASVQLVGKNYDFGWSDEGPTADNHFLGIAIYQFKFLNNSRHILEVKPTFNTSAKDDLLAIKFYKSTTATVGIQSTPSTTEYEEDDFAGLWGDNGALGSGFGLASSLSTFDELTNNTAFDVAPKSGNTAGVMYVYMIVAVKNASTGDVNGGEDQVGDLTGVISFTLTDPGLSERQQQQGD